MTIHYRWHPLFGRSLRVVRYITRIGRDFVHCEMPDSTVARIPRWMTDATECSAMAMGTPQLSLDALVELRRLLDTIAAPSASHRAHGQRQR
ncbi:MAG: DUF5372 family protein [Polyangiaceae bacterium]|nr:DUF5372 family protein [Polyangiaceae bacterium]